MKTAAAAVLALLAGYLIASPDDRWAKLSEDLLEKQKQLLEDLEKVENACKRIQEVRETREAGTYILSPDEKRLEAKAQQDFHIFMERSRNNTLEVLHMYEVALGVVAADPLRTILGKALDEVVQVQFREEALEDVVAQLEQGYHVEMNVRGDAYSRKLMSLEGEMSLRSILEQIELVFRVKLTVEDGKLWFVPTGQDPEAD